MKKPEPKFSYVPDGSAAQAPGSKGGNLILRGEITDEILNQIASFDFQRIVLDYGEWKDLSFLRGKEIVSVLVRGENVDWKSICSLKSLVTLEIESELKEKIDFSTMSNLRYLSVGWSSQVADCINSAISLQALEVRGAIPSLSCLSGLANVEALSIVQSAKLESLDGLDEMKRLSYAVFTNCGKLVKMTDFSKCHQLASINFVTCNKLKTVDALASAPALREVLLDIGNVESINGVAYSPTIERIRFDCTVLDGDLDFLFKMPALKFCLFKNHKNFSRKVSEIQEFLEKKGFAQKELRSSLMRFPAPKCFV